MRNPLKRRKPVGQMTIQEFCNRLTDDMTIEVLYHSEGDPGAVVMSWISWTKFLMRLEQSGININLQDTGRTVR